MLLRIGFCFAGGGGGESLLNIAKIFKRHGF